MDTDTSFCEPYDEAGAPNIKVSGISQHMSKHNKAYDYFYQKEDEGTSPLNIKRKAIFKQAIDHLQNPSQVIVEKMKTFYDRTQSEDGS
jgi:hypothetical protein